jgi:hypothetical protein
MQKGSNRLAWPVDDVLPLFHAAKMSAQILFFYDKNHFLGIFYSLAENTFVLCF